MSDTREELASAVLVQATKKANEKYQDDWDAFNKEPVDDYGYSEVQRAAYVAGALETVMSILDTLPGVLNQMSEGRRDV